MRELPARTRRPLARHVQVELDGRGAAHHAPTRAPGAVEVCLHRVVARPAHHPPAGSERVEAEADQVDAGVADSAAQDGEVGGHGGMCGADPRLGQRAQLDLPPGLEGQSPTSRQWARVGVCERPGTLASATAAAMRTPSFHE